jgi:hypothetical protein
MTDHDQTEIESHDSPVLTLERPAVVARRPYPGRVMGMVGLVLSLIPPLNLAGLFLSIVAKVKSKRAGGKNDVALSGIVVASATIVLTLLAVWILVPPFVNAVLTCAHFGHGVHVIGESTYTCTSDGFSVKKTW